MPKGKQIASTLAAAVLVGVLYFTVPDLFRPPDGPSDVERPGRKTAPRRVAPASRPAPLPTPSPP